MEQVRDPKHYFEFAAQRPTAIGAAVRSMATNDYDSDFEMSVAEGLRRLGWTIRTQIGLSKFRINLGARPRQGPSHHPRAAGLAPVSGLVDGLVY